MQPTLACCYNLNNFVDRVAVAELLAGRPPVKVWRADLLAALYLTRDPRTRSISTGGLAQAVGRADRTLLRRRGTVQRAVNRLDDPAVEVDPELMPTAVLLACLPGPYGRAWNCHRAAHALGVPVLDVRAGLVVAMTEEQPAVMCPEPVECVVWCGR